MQSFEGLGTFYLGAAYDLEQRKRAGEPLLYDSKDLVTHAVCVGMTGSGKTGLCTVLLEEAAIDGIPALVIDPKGDLANLLLAFPQLRPEDFAPWVDPEAAKQKGQSVEEFAAAQAALWTQGLADWGQDGARIARMRDACEFAVYTPGSSAVRPLSILKSFAAPGQETLEDGDALRESVQTTVSSLLALAGVDADPIKSRESILLATVLEQAWRAGRDLDLGAIIQEVQHPSVQRIGVFDLESFFPANARFEFALTLNHLLASPGFASWMEGEPLDLDTLLFTPAGKPRIAIVSIAHLGDAQRMFFVSLLLNQALGWVRRQRGTASLRALIYMDEIAGYFPPVANPPSKAPLLTLMKQARAFGVGVVLATQNPVDLDYKGLANAGTWFIGRLQTERDKARLLDGLEGATASAQGGFDRQATERLIASLEPRTFLMKNVNEDRPVVFQTRWALAYLRGPLTREELRRFAPARAPAAPAAATTAAAPRTPTPAAAAAAQRPVLPPDIEQYFLPVHDGAAGEIEYRPMVLACAQVGYRDAKAGVDEQESVCMLATCAAGPVPVDWDGADNVDLELARLERNPGAGARFAYLPAECAKPKSYAAWKKSCAEAVYRNAELALLRCPGLDEVSRPGEDEGRFRQRLVQTAREKRDAALQKVRDRFASRIAALEERLRKREQAIEVQNAQAREAKLSTAVSFGSTLLSALLGRRARSAGTVGRAATTARGVGRSMKESGDVDRAQADLRSVEQQLAETQAELQGELESIQSEFDAAGRTLEPFSIRPRKTGITVQAVVLAWAPYRADRPAWK